MREAKNPVPQAAVRKRLFGALAFFSRLFKEKPLGAIGAVIVLILLITAIFANVLAPYDYSEVDVMNRLQPPSTNHWLGTDQVGRDVLSRLIFGARVSVIIGLAATTLTVLVGTLIGTLSGFFGGTFDLVMQRFVDAWMAFPGLIVLITAMSLLGLGMLQLILVMGIGWGIGGSRVTRSAVIAIKEDMYMKAAQAIGSPTSRTLFRHILPNIMAPIIIIFTTNIGGVILAEASLSFLGFGLPPDVPSWGGMLSWEGRRYMEAAPMLAFWPGFCLSIIVYGANMFGDGLRDLLDPRLRGGVGGMGSHGSELAQRARKKMEAKIKTRN